MTALQSILVDKSKARVGELARVPRHISEYLLTKFDGDTVKASNFLRKYCPPQSEANIILHKIMSETSIDSEPLLLLDEAYVTPLPKIGLYSVKLTQLDLRTEIYTTSRIVKDNMAILRHGGWGTIALAYDDEGVLTGRKSIVMVGFKPIETAKVDLNTFMNARNFQFSL